MKSYLAELLGPQGDKMESSELRIGQLAAQRYQAVNDPRSRTRVTAIMTMRAFLLICLVSVSAVGQQPDPLPEFSLLTLKGKTVHSQELKDSIVVLDFWATWCEGCITEIPAFNRLEQKYGLRGVKVIGLAVQSGWARDIQKFARNYKMRYTILVGNDDTVSEFGVISFPATYVIAPGWKLHKKYLGVSASKTADIRRDIETLLEAKR
jgi:thiol-disulfide isomerase/thioredoxin